MYSAHLAFKLLACLRALQGLLESIVLGLGYTHVCILHFIAFMQEVWLACR